MNSMMDSINSAGWKPESGPGPRLKVCRQGAPSNGQPHFLRAERTPQIAGGVVQTFRRPYQLVRAGSSSSCGSGRPKKIPD